MLRKIFITIITACSIQLLSDGAEPLRNATPVMAGGELGLSPMSFGMTYSNYPKGFAYISSDEVPDIFVAVKSGTADAKGFWWCRYDFTTEDGHQVYRKPVRCRTPWDGEKTIPSVIKVFQDGDDIWLLRMTTRRIETARWNGSDGFYADEVLPLDGIRHRINSFDCIRRGRNDIEIVLLCNDGKSYRPEMQKGDTQSYYDGAEIYRGELPAAGVFRFHVDNGWHQVSDVEQVSDDMRVVIGPGEIAVVDGGEDNYGGYVITNLLGSMKFIPYMKRLPKGGIHPLHIRKDDGRVLVHKAYSSRLISVPDSRADRCGLLIGGESAMYRYSFGNVRPDGSPVYSQPSEVLEKNAPLYGGSLTVPNVVDWDGDGVLDIVAGNSEGRLLFFKNNGTNRNPDFAMSEEICAGGKPILLRPGYHVVQGPFEASWGYLCPTVYDWNGDGLPDVMVSGSRAKYEIMLNEGTITEPRLAAPVPVMVDNLELYGTWRVRPAITKVNGVNVMVTMDDDNALHLYRQIDEYNVEDAGKLRLEDGRQITGHNNAGELLGQWGRGKLRFVDWNMDGKTDLIVGSIKRSSYPSPDRGLPYSRFKKKETGLQVMFFENVGTDENMVFKEPVQFQVDGKDFYLGAHSNAPEPCMLGDVSDGPNLLVGCESGKYYFFERKHLTTVGIPEN